MRAISIAVLLLLGCWFATPRVQAASPEVGQQAPAFSGHGVNATRLRFDPDQRDKPALILFWATWCPYCKALMPALQSLLDEVGQQRLDVYAVDVFEDGQLDPAAELKARHQAFTLVLAGDAIAADYGVLGTPGLFLVGRDGRIQYVRPNGASPVQVRASLLALLQAPTKP